MQFILYIFSYSLIWLISRLPLSILYGFSSIAYVIIYHILGYRKKVVFTNIEYAFPDKTEVEKKEIAKEFYRHFTDIFMESIKLFTMSKSEIQRRYTYKNPELANKYLNNGRSVALVGAHIANWEWSTSMPLALDKIVYGAYTKLQNKYFEKTLKKTREKFGVVGYKTSDTVKAIVKNEKNNKNGSYILLSDQSPMVKKTYYWAPFFGVNVPVHTGAEMLSKKFNFVVINYVAKKIKRGYYEIEFQLITDEPQKFKDYDITDKYLALTEENIKKQPAYYLWSHNRFKHKDKYNLWLETRKDKK